MASIVMSASAVKAPAVKVSGLGFRKAVSAVSSLVLCIECERDHVVTQSVELLDSIYTDI